MKTQAIILFVFYVSFHVSLVMGGHHEEQHAPVHYKFEYGVHDPHTKDIKSQWEERHGHYVKGAYTLQEADGTFRIVEYTAGPHTGFQAVVKRIGPAQHPIHHGH